MTVYRLHTPASRGRPLDAWTLVELAELVGCAIAEGDPIERISALDRTALALVDELRGDQQEAVRARVIDERDYPDIAKDLRCSEAVVRKRVSRGLGTLRARLEEK
jgi:hypothetical protein